MRKSIRAGRARLLAVAASILLSGGAMAAVMMPAGAVVSPVTVTNPGTQTTTPIGSAVALQIQAADTNALTLTYSSTALPACAAINATTGKITGTATAAFDDQVTVTATDTAAATDSATFTWIVENNIVVTNPGPQTTAEGGTVNLPIAATDNGVAVTLTYAALGLPGWPQHQSHHRRHQRHRHHDRP